MSLIYYFDHEVNGVPQFLTYAFDARYNFMRDKNNIKYIDKIFSDSMIRKLQLEATVNKFLCYWPKINMISWRKTDCGNKYISEVKCMKTKRDHKTIGFPITEEWELDIKNKCISNIREIL